MNVGFHAGRGAMQVHGEQNHAYAEHQGEECVRQIGEITTALRRQGSETLLTCSIREIGFRWVISPHCIR